MFYFLFDPGNIRDSFLYSFPKNLLLSVPFPNENFTFSKFAIQKYIL